MILNFELLQRVVNDLNFYGKLKNEKYVLNTSAALFQEINKYIQDAEALSAPNPLLNQIYLQFNNIMVSVKVNHELNRTPFDEKSERIIGFIIKENTKFLLSESALTGDNVICILRTNKEENTMIIYDDKRY